MAFNSWILVLVAAFTLCASVQGQAEVILKTDDRIVSSWPDPLRATVNAFLTATVEQLPKTLTSHLNKRIEVSFATIDSAPLRTPSCDSPNRKLSWFDTIGGNGSRTIGERPVQVLLHIDFLKAIFVGESGADRLACGPQNLYRAAQIELGKQLFRIYNQERAEPLDESPIWKAILNRLEPSMKESVEQSAPDSLAAYFSYSVFDPDFACRLPTVSSYFDDLFGRAKMKKICQPNATVWAFSTGKKVALDSERLFQIHLLVVNRGTAIESRNGHVMFRLVFCSPERKVINEDCLKDLNHHVVASFVGIPGVIRPSTIDGMLGRYPSRLTIEEFPFKVHEYTFKESRDLTSIPLDLTRLEQQRFISRTIEEYWSYENRYFFFTNNCATEALRFLQSVTLDRSLVLKADPFIETPFGFRDFLKDRRLLRGLSKQDLTPPSYFYFPSAKAAAQGAAQGTIRSPTGDTSSPAAPGADFLLSAAERRAEFDRQRNGDKKHDRELAIEFYKREKAIYDRGQRRIQWELQQVLEQDPKNLGKQYLALLWDIQLSKKLLYPSHRALSGYGIPMRRELRPESEVQRVEEEIQRSKEKIKGLLREDYPWLYTDLKDANDNMKYFYRFIKQAN